MMAPEEYFRKCYLIRYSRKGDLTSPFMSPMNCYGFVYWFYKLCLGIELERGDVECFDNIKCVTYNRVEVPMDGDVVHLRTLSGVYAMHVGIYYKGNIYHFTQSGLMMHNVDRAYSMIKGFYHVAENTKGFIQEK